MFTGLGTAEDRNAPLHLLTALNLTAQFPPWVSMPEVIGPDEEAFAFRWLIGVKTGL